MAGFHGILTAVGYLMPNPLFTYILNTYDYRNEIVETFQMSLTKFVYTDKLFHTFLTGIFLFTNKLFQVLICNIDTITSMIFSNF